MSGRHEDGGASVRWMTNAEPTFGAIGPSHVDPRSGEILAANIGIEGLSSRNIRAARTRVLNGREDFAPLMQLGGAGSGELFDGRACLNAAQAAEQLSYGRDVLEARGDLDPGSPQAQQFVLDYLKGVTLKQLLDDRGSLPIGLVLRIGRQVSEGLEAAHGVGVVHRAPAGGLDTPARVQAACRPA